MSGIAERFVTLRLDRLGKAATAAPASKLMSWITLDVLCLTRLLCRWLAGARCSFFFQEFTIMLYVGIDVSSQKHDCCILCPQGERDRFSFPNSKEGFDLLASKLTESPENTRIGLEATGIYAANLVAFLRRKGFETITFNPLNIKRLIEANTLRKTKTDKSDALFIARLVMQQDPKPDTPALYHISELKSLSRFRFQLVNSRSKAKTKCKEALMLVFPEFADLFSDCFGAAALAVLSKYPSAYDLSKCRKDSLTKLLQNASKGRFGADKAAALLCAAKASVGNYSLAETMKIRFLLAEIAMLTQNIAEVEEKIRELMEKVDSPITTIPGIGLVLGAMILGEIGDIQKFDSPDKLLAFAGLEPSIYQSGKFLPTSGSMVKRGSPYLRWALTQSARLAAMNCPTFSAYLSKKRSEGKHYNVALSHLAKKLVRVIFALLSKNSSFDIHFSA